MSTFRMDTRLHTGRPFAVSTGRPARPIRTERPAWERAALACLEVAHALRARWDAPRHDSLLMLDARMLADLGLDRSDIASIEAERSGKVQRTRRQHIHHDQRG
jgi:hypothetical protein